MRRHPIHVEEDVFVPWVGAHLRQVDELSVDRDAVLLPFVRKRIAVGIDLLEDGRLTLVRFAGDVVTGRADDERGAVDGDREAEDVIRGSVARSQLLLLLPHRALTVEDVRCALTRGDGLTLLDVCARRSDDDRVVGDGDGRAEEILRLAVVCREDLLLVPGRAGAVEHVRRVDAVGTDDGRGTTDADREAEIVEGQAVAGGQVRGR